MERLVAALGFGLAAPAFATRWTEPLSEVLVDANQLDDHDFATEAVLVGLKESRVSAVSVLTDGLG
jgi:hypothetical protein